MTIRVHVERLVVDGMNLTLAGRAQLERAYVAEVTRVFSRERVARELGVVHSGGVAVAALRAADVWASAGEPAALGEQLGRSVCGALRPGAERSRSTSVPRHSGTGDVKR